MTSVLADAITADEAGDVRRACALYETAVAALLEQNKTLDEKAKQANLAKISSCLDRAETLKAQLQSGGSNKRQQQ